MTIKAVVFDIGGVLEHVDDASWPGTWLGRWAQHASLPVGQVLERIAEALPEREVQTGGVSETQVRAAYADALGLDATEADVMMAELWDGYCGELDEELRDFAASLRPAYRTAILSNSADGARREEQRRYGFEELVDTIVYSHEVGLAKPDPAVFRLTERRLGVEPQEVAFLDDHEGHVRAALDLGWHAVHHVATPRSIREVTALLAR